MAISSVATFLRRTTPLLLLIASIITADSSSDDFSMVSAEPPLNLSSYPDFPIPSTNPQLTLHFLAPPHLAFMSNRVRTVLNVALSELQQRDPQDPIPCAAVTPDTAFQWTNHGLSFTLSSLIGTQNAFKVGEGLKVVEGYVGWLDARARVSVKTPVIRIIREGTTIGYMGVVKIRSDQEDMVEVA